MAIRMTHLRLLPTLPFFFSALLACCILVSPASAQDTEPDDMPPAGWRSVGTNKVAALEALCRATADTGLFSGAVLVADEGEVIYKEAFGLANREWQIPNTTDTKFRLASVSKQFCTMVVMQLVQDGRLKLDDTVSDHLPTYREDTGKQITIHHLMAHQSGLPDFTANGEYRSRISRVPHDKDAFIREHCSGDLLHEPGTIYSYCNAGYILLGRIIEKVTRRSFEQNVQARIFTPLGMANSGYDRNRPVLKKRASGYTRGPFEVVNADYMEMDSTPGAAGSLYSTVEDMFRWDRALYTDKLLNKEHRERMFTPNRDVPEVAAAGGRAQSRYGYGWQIYTRTHPVTKHRVKVVNHGGAINGFRAMENRLVEEDAFVMVLCNLGDAQGSSEVWRSVMNLSTELIHVVTDQPYRLPPKPRPSQDQRLYAMVKSQGAEAAAVWFEEKGKRAAWGGTTMKLAQRLIDDGRPEDGLRFMELEMKLNPKKVWILRKTAEAYWAAGRSESALQVVEKALALKPEDERLTAFKAEIER